MPTRSRLATFLAPLTKALLVLGLVVLAGAWPAYAMDGQDGLVAFSVAALIGFLGFVLGRLPHLFLTQGPDAIFHASLAGLGLRLLGTLSIATPLLFFSPLSRTPFAMGLVLSYFALLILEVVDLVRAAQPITPDVEDGRESVQTGSDGAHTR